MLINGRQLHVEFHGLMAGPPLILLHHGLGSTRAWRQTIPALADAGYRVIAYDRWGYGRSDPRLELGAPLFAEDQRDLLALMDKLALRDAALVGHSDGGTIALYFASRYPRRVNALVTVAAHVYIEEKMHSGILAVKRQFDTQAEFRAALEAIHGEKTDHVFKSWFGGWASPAHRAWDIRPLLERIECPALVVQGAEDEFATPAQARDLAESLTRSQLWVVPAAGHMLPQDQQELFNNGLLQFLRSLEAD